MKFVKKDEGFDGPAPGHYQWLGRNKLVPGKDTKYSLFVVSHFLPDGGTEPGSAPGELIYYCISGKMRFKSGGQEVIMEPGDTVYVPPGEVREFKTIGFDTAQILCVYNP
jgi:quercetin dioxygenase-like cupin family protein